MPDRFPPRARRLRLGLGVAAGVGVLLALGATRAATSPRVAERALGALFPGRVFTVEDVEVLPTSRPLDPSTWRLALVGIAANTGEGAVWTVERLHLGLPDPEALGRERRLRFRHARLVGLRGDGAAGALEPRLPAGLRGIDVERLELWGADLILRSDRPEAEAHLDGVRGELLEVGWEPGAGWRADGRLAIRSARAGGLAVADARVRAFAVRESTAWFDARFALARGDARLRGEITGWPADPALSAALDLTGARLAEAAWRTTGHDPPADGRLDASLQWTLLPGSPARAEGTIRVTETRIPLGEDRAFLASELLRLSPHVTLDDGALVVEEAQGPVRVEGRAVRIDGLRARTGRTDLAMWGELRPDRRRVVVRVSPGRGSHARPAFGLVLEGDERLRLRLADKVDLRPPGRGEAP